MKKAQNLLIERKGIIGLVAFMACLWVAVVATYAAQIRTEPGSGKSLSAIPLTNASCNSNSSSGGTGSLKPPGSGNKSVR